MPNAFDEITPVRGRGPGERELGVDNITDTLTPEERNQLAPKQAHILDGDEARKELRKLLEWFYYEREKQATNRLEMAMDADFYDNLQWTEEDAQALRERGQMPLVYNEIAPMVDWIIGTERRTRVDWDVLPRSEDDVEMADIKKKVMKWLSDINRVTFNRSRAFADAVKVGVGWVDDGVRDDPTQEIIYDRYEDWRNVLWDSASYELDLSDARFLFRWRWVDEDIAVMMFPDRRDAILKQVVEGSHQDVEGWDLDTWTTGYEVNNTVYNGRSGSIYATGQGAIADAKRKRIKLIECQYRKPVRVKVVADGPMAGAFYDERDQAMSQALALGGGTIIDKVMMRVHFAVFTESDMLAMGPSIFRHNRFSLTPIWCYRRGRDRLPYGVIRRVRDMQQDLNKRASKALFMLNTNQIIADEGAVDDLENLRDEVDRPDGLIVKKTGKEIEIRRDTDAATGQIQMMTLAAQSIQKAAGVSQENLGRQTNAVSGEAIKARQLQGSVVTTEPFDNLRLATQIQGEKLMSLSEQFLTEEKVVRLTGDKGKIEWLKINQPEQQWDGSIRYINDITSSQADFVVAEQDYAGSLRQVMFDSLNQLATRLPPEVSLRLMTVALEYSDLPNKDEIADQIRSITGERDPNKPMTPEEMEQQAQQMQAQAEAMQMQKQQAMLALEEQAAKVRELNAKAAKIEAEAMNAGAGGDQQGMELQQRMQEALMQVRQQAADQVDRMADQLRKLQSDLANRTLQINKDADAKLETARIDADAKIRVAEIQNANDKALDAINKRLEMMTQALEKRIKDAESKAVEMAKPKDVAPAAPAQPASPPPAPAPITINVEVDAKNSTSKSIQVKRDEKGDIVGADVIEDQPAEPKPKAKASKATRKKAANPDSEG